MLADVVGTVGVLIIIITYLLLQLEKIKSTDLLYSILNVIGSLLIVYSLLFNWNFSSFLIEFFWILISLYGIFKYFRNKKPS